MTMASKRGSTYATLPQTPASRFPAPCPCNVTLSLKRTALSHILRQRHHPKNRPASTTAAATASTPTTVYAVSLLGRARSKSTPAPSFYPYPHRGVGRLYGRRFLLPPVPLGRGVTLQHLRGIRGGVKHGADGVHPGDSARDAGVRAGEGRQAAALAARHDGAAVRVGLEQRAAGVAGAGVAPRVAGARDVRRGGVRAVHGLARRTRRDGHVDVVLRAVRRPRRARRPTGRPGRAGRRVGRSARAGCGEAAGARHGWGEAGPGGGQQIVANFVNRSLTSCIFTDAHII